MTKQALEKSIKHWEENVAAENFEDINISAKACALCNIYNLTNKPCENCPVSMTTNRICCQGTPYEKVADLWYEQKDNNKEPKNYKETTFCNER